MKDKLEFNLIVNGKVHHESIEIPKDLGKFLDSMMGVTEFVVRNVLSLRMTGKAFEELDETTSEKVEKEFEKEAYGE